MPIIEVKNLGKRYEIGEQERYLALRDTLANIFKSPLSWLKTKVISGQQREEFWALRDVNFNVNQGEVLGIIGRNGAGKSTLLKILSQITPPTTGKVTLRGRVGSLLEVGTGFHPELTGRENIYLNGAILGMRKKEIEKKFDQIVEFAGIGQFLDTPVKRYSSGMYVRLAFAVAAHLEPDILVVDEVLAVGDAEFQKKCLGKMEEITKKDGRTVLFVSHNLSAIQQLCPNTLLLERGRVVALGKTSGIIDLYLNSKMGRGGEIIEFSDKKKDLAITKIVFKNSDRPSWCLDYKEPLKIEVYLKSLVDIPSVQLGIGVDTLSKERILTVHSTPIEIKKGLYKFLVEMQNLLVPGTYSLSLGILNQVYLPDVTSIEIYNKNSPVSHKEYNYGFVDVDSRMTVSRISN